MVFLEKLDFQSSDHGKEEEEEEVSQTKASRRVKEAVSAEYTNQIRPNLEEKDELRNNQTDASWWVLWAEKKC